MHVRHSERYFFIIMMITFFAQVVYSEEDVSRVHTLSLNEARQLFPHGVSSKLATEVLTFTHCKVFFSESIHIQYTCRVCVCIKLRNY